MVLSCISYTTFRRLDCLVDRAENTIFLLQFTGRWQATLFPAVWAEVGVIDSRFLLSGQSESISNRVLLCINITQQFSPFQDLDLLDSMFQWSRSTILCHEIFYTTFLTPSRAVANKPWQCCHSTVTIRRTIRSPSPPVRAEQTTLCEAIARLSSQVSLFLRKAAFHSGS
jgi:hypothetical protein